MTESSSSSSSSFTSRRWRDPAPPAEEEHRGLLPGGRSEAGVSGIPWEMTMGPAAAEIGGESYPPAAAAAAAAPCFFPPSPAGRRRPSLRAPAPFAPRAPAAARLFCEPRPEDEGRHFLDACALCRKPLGSNRDIFMYRGDVPFCTEECRQEQIDRDEARERSLGGAMKASSSRNASSSPEHQGIRVPAAGAIVAG